MTDLAQADLVREVAPSASSPEILPSTLCAGFDHVRQGLYVFVFSNTGANVFDNPKNAERRKIVIQGQGVSIKPGKFETGLADRLTSYVEHLHRTTEDGDHELVFSHCLKHAYLLDLTKAIATVVNPAPIFEPYWIAAVNRYLQRENLLARTLRQKKRSEWRYVDTERWTPTRRIALKQYLECVAQRVFEMAHVGAFDRIDASTE